MGLKTNSRKAKENLKHYILTRAAGRIGEDNEKPFSAIYAIFKEEKSGEYYRRQPESVVFEDWAQGLAMDRLFEHYLIDAREPVAAILEQTPEEAARYTDEAAAELLTALIYRTITDEARKGN